MSVSRRVAAALIAVAGSLPPGVASAWIYPEHRDIAVEAIRRAPAAELATLERLWTDARPEYPAKLCPALSVGD